MRLVLLLVLSVTIAGCGSKPDPTAWRYSAFKRDADSWRTSPANAEATARVCERDLSACGLLVLGDADWLASSCQGVDVAAAIRAAAAAARDEGTEVFTRTETGGYPWGCRFAALELLIRP